MSKIYLLVKDRELIPKIRLVTKLPIINNLNYIDVDNDILVVLQKELDTTFNRLLGSRNYKHLIVIGLSNDEDSIRFSSFSNGKIGCPKCINTYIEESFYKLHNIDLKINYFDETILQILKIKNKSKYQQIIDFSGNGNIKLNLLFPSIYCGECKDLYDYSFRKPNPHYFNQKSVRNLNHSMIEKIVSNIPFGQYSMFDKPEIFKYNDIYISRVKIKDEKKTYGIGRSYIKHKSINIAVLESLERLSLKGFMKFSKSVRDKYTSLDNAIHPEILIGNKHSFNKKLKYHWIEGLELNTNKKVLIPEQIVFLQDNNTLQKKKELRFYSPTSNGTSLGGSYIESVFFAILECLERHYGLRAWGYKENLMRWRLSFFDDNQRIMKLINFFKENNCEVHIISTSNIKVISTVWIYLSWDDGQLNTLGSGISPNEAVEGALLELFTGFLNFKNISQEQLVRTDYLIQTNKLENMEDHVLYYLQKKKNYMFSFIKDTPYEKVNDFEELTSLVEEENNKGISNILESLLREMEKLNKKVYAVNITPPIVKQIYDDFSVVKAFISNSNQFNFGCYDNNHNPHPFL